MRPVIVAYLNRLFHTTAFNWLVPELAMLYAGAIFACVLVFIRRVKISGLSEFHGWSAALCGALAGIVGVRLWWLLLHLGQVVDQPSLLLDLNGPTISFGGYFFGLIAFVGYLWSRRQGPLPYLDVLASCLGLGPMIARWACFLNGDDYGTPSTLPWAVRYPAGSYAFADHLNRGWIRLADSVSLPVHPVQIYLSFKGLALFLICSWLWKRKVLAPGGLFGAFWLLYALLRFTMEFFRGDSTDVYPLGLTYGQWVCVLIALAAAVYLRFLAAAPSRQARVLGQA